MTDVVSTKDVEAIVVLPEDNVQAVSSTSAEFVVIDRETVSVVATTLQTVAAGQEVTANNVLEFTNKTLDDYSNTIHADQLHSHVKALEFIPKGSPVRFGGFNSGENAVEVYLADNTVAPAIGVAEEDLDVGEFGLIATHGTMSRLDTHLYSPGTILYPDSNGGFTDVPPTTGFQQPLAFVLRAQQNNGAILVSAGYPKQNVDDIPGISPYSQTLLSSTSASQLRQYLEITHANLPDTSDPDLHPIGAISTLTDTLATFLTDTEPLDGGNF